MPPPLAITTSGKCDDSVRERAQAFARKTGLPLHRRGYKAPLGELFGKVADAFLVFEADAVVLADPLGSLSFHPGMAHLRIKALEAGERDRLVEAGELRAGDSVLDCTLGLAQDALVAARAVGPEGRVVGLEKSFALWAVVSEGLGGKAYDERSCAIDVRHADAASVLRESPAGSFDVVVFDPMFERPRKSQPAFEVLRRHADHSPLTPEVFEEARRVARRWVVVKGSRYSTDLKKLGLVPERASRSATTVFGRVAGLGPRGVTSEAVLLAFRRRGGPHPHRRFGHPKRALAARLAPHAPSVTRWPPRCPPAWRSSVSKPAHAALASTTRRDSPLVH